MPLADPDSGPRTTDSPGSPTDPGRPAAPSVVRRYSAPAEPPVPGFADRALHHLDVPIRHSCMPSSRSTSRSQSSAFFGSGGRSRSGGAASRRTARSARHVARQLIGRHRVALARQYRGTRPRASARRRLLERGARAAARAEPLDRAARLPAEHELELPKLIRLEAARCLKPVSKRQELERRHRLEDVHLRHEHL